MSIKVLHTEWSDGWGGQEIRIIEEMSALREKGVELFLACREHSTIREKAEEKGFGVYILPFKGNVDIVTLLKLIRIIKANNIDIINTHSGKDTWVGGIAAKLTGRKFIRTRHLSNRIKASKFNFINELADFIFTTGVLVREDMIKYNRINPQKIMSVPTGIDENIFAPALYDYGVERKRLQIEKNEIAIGIIAVIRAFKRHDLFILAAQQLLQRHDNLKFFIAGDGSKKDEMIRLVNDNNLRGKIIFLGHISEPARLLSALDVFTLTSDSKEGVPQSVMQALFMNKKVLATNAGSTSDLYNNNFQLVRPNNLKEIVDGIELLISDKGEKYTQSREYMMRNFTRSIMSEKIYSTYEDILKK